MDIPIDYFTNRIKGVLKYFGKISNIRIIKNNSKNRKSIQITIEL